VTSIFRTNFLFANGPLIRRWRTSREPDRPKSRQVPGYCAGLPRLSISLVRWYGTLSILERPLRETVVERLSHFFGSAYMLRSSPEERAETTPILIPTISDARPLRWLRGLTPASARSTSITAAWKNYFHDFESVNFPALYHLRESSPGARDRILQAQSFIRHQGVRYLSLRNDLFAHASASRPNSLLWASALLLTFAATYTSANSGGRRGQTVGRAGDTPQCGSPVVIQTSLRMGKPVHAPDAIGRASAVTSARCRSGSGLRL